MLLMKCAELKEKVQKSRKARVCICPAQLRRKDYHADAMRLALFEEVKRGGCRLIDILRFARRILDDEKKIKNHWLFDRRVEEDARKYDDERRRKRARRSPGAQRR